ncbi:MAG: PHP domain-containing protein [Candidatus Methanoperedens sp.]|nr:PHP domain-containing protein [Candidatus Methanoperedens sp.]MCE8429465.1 PHP domain-containing protein [Candidatus Methanoperedens sp.]
MEIMNQEIQQGRADTHVHTRCSGFGRYSFLHFPESITEPAKAVEAARRKKLDILCITDHNTIKGAIIAKKHATGIEVVIGEEISSAHGEILALFIQEEIKPNLGAPETIDLIHDQGGVAIAAHPFSPQCPSLGKKICYLKLDGVEVFNAYHRDVYSNLMAQTLSPGKLARLGSSDAHSIDMIGNGYTIFDGRTSEELRKSILKRKTSFGGSKTPLKECMSWSREIAVESIRLIYNSLKGEKSQDILYSAIDKTTKKTKALGLICAALYIGLPLSYFFGVSGEIILYVKGKRKWNENI